MKKTPKLIITSATALALLGGATFVGAQDVPTPGVQTRTHLSDLTPQQQIRLQEARALFREGDRQGAKQILDELGIKKRPFKRAFRHGRHSAEREAIKNAVAEQDYEKFQELVIDHRLAEVIETEEDFDKLVEAHGLRESGDKEGARAILEELGFKRGSK